MENKKKGCVYFFRHIGLTPVKIGYSREESPINRFEAFKTYAPYGSELLGFIMNEEAKSLESVLHDRFSYARLKGEWFEISKDDVDKVVSFYSNIEDIKYKNEFEIAWAKRISESNNIISDSKSFDMIFSTEENETHTQKTIISQSEIIEQTKIKRHVLKNILEEKQVFQKVYRWNKKLKRGYLLYKSENVT